MNAFSISPLNGDLEKRMSLAKVMARLIAFEIPPVYEDTDPSERWTIAIRSVLRQLMPPEWTMFPPNDNTCAGEFLVDSCWWAGRGGAALVAEFEWGSHWEEILEDFDKIAVIKAPFKLMIHQSSRGEVTSLEIEKRFHQYLSAYKHHIAGETYIFIEYLPNDFVRSFAWQASCDGPVSKVEFAEIFGPEKFERKWVPPRDNHNIERPAR
ncbi:MAG: hypothetical protein M3R43_09530 [Acidobacteriota bacterium]|nr:hypothetical protein [Acidobacteriota bacterium]